MRTSSGRISRWLGRAALAWALVVPVVVVLAVPPTMQHAEAKKRRKKKKKKKRGTRQEIRREGGLSPKREYSLDEEITKTKDLKTIVEEKRRPTLSLREMRRSELEGMVEEKLNEEIDLARQLADLTPECKDGAPIQFRLADLYWEQSKRVFFKSQDFDKYKQRTRKRFEQDMVKLQNLTVDHYRQIVDDCPAYPDYAKVLFFLGNALVELERQEEGVKYFQQIITDFPDSTWVGNAWFMAGEYFFKQKNDAFKALRAYKRAEDYTDSAFFGQAVYMQGWCYINTGDWDQALERFERVVAISVDPGNPLEKKGRVALRREALKDYVRAYSHVGESKTALRRFRKVGGKDVLDWMLEQLGGWYINQDAHSDTVVTYRELIKNFGRSTRLPVWQGRIVDAVSKMGEKKAVVAQAKLLTEYFTRVRNRIKRGDLSTKEREAIDKDIAEAEEIAENTLRRLAMDYHKDAKKLRGSTRDRMYKLAHDLYKHYLAVFPEPDPQAEVNYVFFMRFYYAETLYKLENFKEAAKNYDIVVDMDPHPKDKKKKGIVLAAAEESVRAYRELVEDLDRKNPPEISGTKPKPLPDVKQRLIHSCRRYIDYVGSEGEKIVEIRYMMARIYYTYNHFDKAAPAFNDIVANHPSHEVACYAANLALDIYKGAENYRALKETSRSYLDNDKLACGDTDRERFAQIEERSAFKMIQVDLEDKKKYLAAAKAYLQFYKEFPKSKSADDAVYNASVNYDLAQRIDKANEVRQFLVEKVKGADPEIVRETLLNIAKSYQRIVDFANAARYLELYAQRYPKDSNSKDALFNAGLYRAALQQFEGSRRNRTRFLQMYPRDDDAADVAFKICEAAETEAEVMEKAGKDKKSIHAKWVEAHDCYFNWAKNKSYASDTDALCHAQNRRRIIMRDKTNYTKGVQDQKNYLLKNWPKWKKKGLTKLPRCASAIAEISFKEQQPQFKKYKGMLIAELNPTNKGKKKFDASVKAKVEARDALVAEYKKVVEFGDPEWGLAALYHIAEALKDSVDKLLAAPIPTKVQKYKLTEEDKQQLRDQLKQMTPEIEKQAVEAYRLCVDKANELGVYNKWSNRALKRLQELRPEEFQPVEEQVVEVAFSDPLTVARNSIVVREGDVWRSLGVGVEDRGARPTGAKKKTDKSAAMPEEKPKKKGKKGRRGRGGAR